MQSCENQSPTLDSRHQVFKNAAMHRWVKIAICVFIACLVVWILVHPTVDLAPTAFRFAAFAGAVMLLLRFCFRFVKPQIASCGTRPTIFPLAFAAVPIPRVSAVTPLRC